MKPGLYETLERLAATLEERKGADPHKSYVAGLLAGPEDSLLKKIGEEATETVLAAKSGERLQLVNETADLAKIKAPVLGHYGGDDARVNATIPPAEGEMKRLSKPYEPHIYEGAGHGFLRAQGDRAGANLRATEQSWPLTVAFLTERLR